MSFFKLMAPVAAVVGSLTLAGAALADPASAKAAVDSAKAAGVVGEQADGFLGFVNAGAASGDVKAAVAEINAGRRQLYSQAAAKNGVTQGKTATTFGPSDPCTRGQIVTFLWRCKK